MIRSLWFALRVALVIVAAIWVMDHPGDVVVTWQGYIIETSVAALIAGMATLMLVATFLYDFWRGVKGMPVFFSRWLKAARQKKGYRALMRGLVSVSAGDVRAAERFARRADANLSDEPLALLLTAQAARLAGNEEKARLCYLDLLGQPHAAFLGVRGLLSQALAEDKLRIAVRLARQAIKLEPRSRWMLNTLFQLEVRAGDWDKAEATLRTALRNGALLPHEADRSQVAFFVARSQAMEADGRHREALDLATRAHDLRADFVPAATQLARLLLADGSVRATMRVVERSWKLSPHPDLAAIWIGLKPDVNELERVNWIGKLLALQPQSVEARLAFARVALSARLWGEARAKMLAAVEGEASVRVFQLLADIELAEHGHTAQALEAAGKWLSRAADAPRDPVWACSACGAPQSSWNAVCPLCGAFGGIDWRVTDARQASINPGETHNPALMEPLVITAAS
ncbi:MAG TPA: heme biosynthesis protein HemY [Rhodospirillaceae bacterium]|nr:MAG: hypothetical protein A2018_00600 [Alphaproteobacteria bacterium GWF2_58_20]HAU28679.1 heme biosynthesis protein HemY [Rhodospirillaceae bacterium]